ncbi:TPA: 6-phosphofructokinase [Legionella pneumophila]|uniref:Pyrophosphate--fructose 6-phosphate 1-phosphotransferase n=3 Tax=Legionella pneumophila TaxID=446 RepID=Q5ZU94_LEGPH|nr:6-phosphofructokinase [Legionella pneumophila]AAU27983.1 6-phosphofructokinase [Legionella pneumophila subsp. pneumophila str. Philadelphia 1]AEW52105.1 6-phosphofructokinase [Legionella pneumophila subsp. pneumophila ATCC 43290]AGH53368.1 6-phosphofructokinase [Legionella pneumophila subsp. pneumophila LPE509]AGN14791.1 6-phosphofructokinase [Legionella pneumophila subsp. pneumophila str. Thunder Bay]AOU04882.1 6-phosphofructokinase [Legionella pneumophila]
MSVKNAIYAQSGGVTAVINASACGVIQTAKLFPEQIGKVYAAKNGIIGALNEELIDTSLESEEDIAKLMQTPSGAFGSCRYKLKDNGEEYQRLIAVFKAHNIGYFFYNGGGDSQDTAHKVSQLGKTMGYPITCIGIPKTVDNDLPFTDNCPGFGSVAKYIAISTKEAGFDVASMAASSTKVFILEVMGRHAGWIAAASGLAEQNPGEPPHIILLPEVPFEPTRFLKKVKDCVNSYGYCVIVVSEGIRNKEGKFLSEAGLRDAFGHAQLGGVAPVIAQLIKSELGFKYHWAVADYLQRAARHIASQTDLDQAYALGKAAVEYAVKGYNAIMPVVIREQDEPYQWSIGQVPLAEVANQEKAMPPEYIAEDGMGITDACKRYLSPLIQGEAYPNYKNGLPDYVRLKNQLVAKKINQD